MTGDDVAQRFSDIWMYCMLDHKVGTLPGGPCIECINKYVLSGPPDGEWNKQEAS